ncbi:MAG TPA: glycosyltransferase family 39 protein [Patescibacteria group bacterium]|nr:glycosyltransferase family 39 protein [Patescibacteria group bacterium]
MRNIVLVCILILAAGVRLIGLSGNPPGIHSDEADIGYAAQSVMETGRSQYGDGLGLVFHEFNGGLFPPIYSYVLVPFLWAGGLSIGSIRLPSAIFGVLSVALLYFLMRTLCRRQGAALWAAFLLAVNPWHLYYSRQGRFESIGIFFVLLGALLFLAMGKRKGIGIMSAISFGIAILANDAAKLFVPMFVPVLIWYHIVFKRTRLASLIPFFSVLLFFGVLMFGVLFVRGQIKDFSRAGKATSAEIAAQVDAERRHTLAPLWLSRVVHNKATVLAKRYLVDYTKNFSLNWFFVEGHWNLQESMGRHGQYLLFELPVFFLGLFVIFHSFTRAGVLLFLWMLLANIPGAITQGDYYPYRSIFMLIPPLAFSAMGMDAWWAWVRRRPIRIRYLLMVGSTLAITTFVGSFLVTHFFDYPVYASEWRYKERTDMLRYALSVRNNYDSVFISGSPEFAVVAAVLDHTPAAVFQEAFRRPVSYKGKAFMQLGILWFGSIMEKDIVSPKSYFPRRSLIMVEGNTFASELPIAEFRAASEPLRVVYKAFEVR